jgi:hypothetical protein
MDKIQLSSKSWMIQTPHGWNTLNSQKLDTKPMVQVQTNLLNHMKLQNTWT